MKSDYIMKSIHKTRLSNCMCIINTLNDSSFENKEKLIDLFETMLDLNDSVEFNNISVKCTYAKSSGITVYKIILSLKLTSDSPYKIIDICIDTLVKRNDNNMSDMLTSKSVYDIEWDRDRSIPSDINEYNIRMSQLMATMDISKFLETFEKESDTDDI